MIKTFFTLLLSFAAFAATAATPVKVILETDMGNDIDDAVALDILCKAADSKEVEILGVCTHKLSETAPVFVDVMDTFYGYGHVPVGKAEKQVRNDVAYDYTRVALRRDSEGKRIYPTTHSQYEDAVTLYRRLLSKAPDHSVVVVSLGFSTTLDLLLKSGPDKYSSLSGRDLVARKVTMLSIMAGSFIEKPWSEYNIRNDIFAARRVFDSWPTKIIVNPFEPGRRTLLPASTISEGLSWAENHPLRDSYCSYKKMPYDRPTWDPMSVVYVLHPEMFTASKPGIVTVSEKGVTTFREDEKGNFIVLDTTPEQEKALVEYMVKTVTTKPRCWK